LPEFKHLPQKASPYSPREDCSAMLGLAEAKSHGRVALSFRDVFLERYASNALPESAVV
jgi:hypothetical protein